LEQHGPQQWPLPTGATEGTARLYADGRFPTETGRARFVPVAWQPVAEARSAQYPLALNTGRLRDQWHGMSRTGTVGRLYGHAPEPVVQMHPQDMARRHLREGELVAIHSRRGSIFAPLQGSSDLGLGQAYMAMHWGEEALGGHNAAHQALAGVNTLLPSAFCPQSKQPELKNAAVRIEKAGLPWSLLAMAWLPAADWLAARTGLQALMARFPFTSCVPFSPASALDGAPEGGTPAQVGLLFRAAAHEPPPEALLARIEALLDLEGPRSLRYADARQGQRRTLRLESRNGDTLVRGLLLAGDTRAQVWLRTLVQDELPAQDYGRLLLAPGATPPVALAARGRTVCSCVGVSDSAIQAALAAHPGSDDERLAHLQASLRCGTQCGSCVPELRRMVRQAAPSAP
ncbi:MAG: molybdopterin dinucleotide binding domain-containing protein, partial [Burkholderiaceae bacterium]|nr:molybdopterin dinucleotide binding domain-containing protein [Burkholderiaceae bacterium]